MGRIFLLLNIVLCALIGWTAADMIMIWASTTHKSSRSGIMSGKALSPRPGASPESAGAKSYRVLAENDIFDTRIGYRVRY